VRAPLLRLWPWLLPLCLSAACDDLSDYKGSFEGGVVQGNFVRSCFRSSTRATLRFDPEHAVASVGDLKASELNRLTTDDGTFDKTPLEPIVALSHDQLSELDFPGPRRLRNFMLLARPEKGPLAGRDAMVVVSLLENGNVELRIMARTESTEVACPTESEGDAGALVAGTPAERPREYFGVFILK